MPALKTCAKPTDCAGGAFMMALKAHYRVRQGVHKELVAEVHLIAVVRATVVPASEGASATSAATVAPAAPKPSENGTNSIVANRRPEYLQCNPDPKRFEMRRDSRQPKMSFISKVLTGCARASARYTSITFANGMPRQRSHSGGSAMRLAPRRLV
eukprot:IDg14351t1